MRDGIGIRCAFCGTGVDPKTERVESCRKCYVLYHRECWRLTRVCTIYGCGWTARRWFPWIACSLNAPSVAIDSLSGMFLPSVVMLSLATGLAVGILFHAVTKGRADTEWHDKFIAEVNSPAPQPDSPITPRGAGSHHVIATGGEIPEDMLEQYELFIYTFEPEDP